MAIIGMQRRIREVGRIRLGMQSEKNDGTRYPRKLDKFRLTSPDRTVIEAAARLYGGTAKPWNNNGMQEHEVFTEASSIPMLLPPDPERLGWSQFYEQWGNRVCQKRCNGEWDSVRDVACDCDPEDRACKATSRLSVFLPEIPGFGVWRVESHGRNAAIELLTAVEVLVTLAGINTMVPAKLRLDMRRASYLINGEVKSRTFAVPVIDIDISVTQVQALGAGGPSAPALSAPSVTPVEIAEPGWKPVAALEEGAGVPVAPSIDEQLAERKNAPAKAKRANSRAPLPSTGRKPRSAAERHAGTPAASATEVCSLCGDPYAGKPVVRNREKWDRDGVVSRFVHRDCEEAERIAALDGEDEPEDGAAPAEPADTPSAASVIADTLAGKPVPLAELDAARDKEFGEAPPSAADAINTPPPLVPNGGPRMPTHKMHKQIFALLAEVFPIPPGTPDANEMRRATESALCEALGTPGIESHKEITFDLARLLIDALMGLQAGTLTWQINAEEGTGTLLAAETGEPIKRNEEDE